MDSKSYPQIRIVPIRMLEADNGEKFLDGLSFIPGIRRLLVHGPGYMNTPEKPEDYYHSRVPSSTMVTISEQQVPLHVLMGDIIVEAIDEKAIQKVADYCDEFFDYLPFQILVGKFIKTEPSLSDYLGEISGHDPYDPFFVGLLDSRVQIDPLLITPPCPDSVQT